MVLGAQSSGNFLVTDLASVTVGPGYVTYPTLLSLDLPVYDLEIIWIQCKVTGGTGAVALNCIFKFVASADGTNWTTEYFVQLKVPMNGTNAIVKGWHTNVIGIHSLRLQQIENEETEANRTATLCNARWGKSFGGKQF